MNIERSGTNGVQCRPSVFLQEEQDWVDGHKIFPSQARIFGFATELATEDKIKVGAEDSSDGGAD